MILQAMILRMYIVTALAKSIAENEGVNDTLVIELACLLHDTVDEKVVDANIQYVGIEVIFYLFITINRRSRAHFIYY